MAQVATSIRLDLDVWAKLEEMSQKMDRSKSYILNMAIRYYYEKEFCYGRNEKEQNQEG